MTSSKRERELGRMRAARQTARREAAEARRKRQRSIVLGAVAGLAVVGVVVAAVLFTGGDKKKTDSLAKAAPASTAATGSCTYTKGGSAAKPVTGLPSVKGSGSTAPANVTLTTNQGVVGLALNTAKAPCTVNSFTFLAKQKYFDATSCHRLTTKGIFVLQCGDPIGTGSGGPGYKFADENLKGATYPAGTVAMANSGAGTNGSQFFLVYKATQLAPSYSPFGTITKGLDVLTRIAAGGSTPSGDGKPNLPVTITKATVLAS